MSTKTKTTEFSFHAPGIEKKNSAVNCITIRGSFVGTRQDTAEALAFAADGKVKADIELQPLSVINQVLERLESGQVASRVVLTREN